MIFLHDVSEHAVSQRAKLFRFRVAQLLTPELARAFSKLQGDNMLSSIAAASSLAPASSIAVALQLSCRGQHVAVSPCSLEVMTGHAGLCTMR
jgi:hypothetical protein